MTQGSRELIIEGVKKMRKEMPPPTRKEKNRLKYNRKMKHKRGSYDNRD